MYIPHRMRQIQRERERVGPVFLNFGGVRWWLLGAMEGQVQPRKWQ